MRRQQKCAESIPLRIGPKDLFACLVGLAFVAGFAPEARASCENPNSCLCPDWTTAIVRVADSDTPWVVDVLEVLRDEPAGCEISVGDRIALYQMMEPDFAPPNHGLDGSGKPLSTYFTPGADMGSGDVPGRPDLPPDRDLLVGVNCREMYPWYLIIEGEEATCNPKHYHPAGTLTRRVALEDAVAANSGGDCVAVLDALYPPGPCNDVVVENETATSPAGCQVAGSPSGRLALLLLAMAALLRLRRSQSDC